METETKQKIEQKMEQKLLISCHCDVRDKQGRGLQSQFKENIWKLHPG